MVVLRNLPGEITCTCPVISVPLAAFDTVTLPGIVLAGTPVAVLAGR